ncbi:hypothetical protein RND71_002333 [Anisodus tanguticus]|uniref:Uncharacterized protein n=1 Tax=Anisodus tanguticus TaxID=243964 RepID=A0AAE1VWH4_9SOLA|nr:hypothetical protein RND71_002333 [Anisodus tanguticus]
MSSRSTGGQYPPRDTAASQSVGAVCGGDMMCDAQQTCPRPNGFERNLRSKTRWFTGFWNSHQVSHFVMFFIDARAEISIVESRFHFKRSTRPSARAADGARDASYRFSVPWRFLHRGSLVTRRARESAGDGRETHGGGAEARRPRGYPGVLNMFAGRSAAQVSTMIHLLVHLRKSCYDFSFL